MALNTIFDWYDDGDDVCNDGGTSACVSDDDDDGTMEDVTMTTLFVSDQDSPHDCWVEHVPCWVHALLTLLGNTVSLHGLCVQTHSPPTPASLGHDDRFYALVANLLSVFLVANTGATCTWADLLASVPSHVVMKGSGGAETCFGPTRYAMLALWFIVHARALTQCTDRLAERFVREVDALRLQSAMSFWHGVPAGVAATWPCKPAEDAINNTVARLVDQMTGTMYNERYYADGELGVDIVTTLWAVRCTRDPRESAWTLARLGVTIGVNTSASFLHNNQLSACESKHDVAIESPAVSKASELPGRLVPNAGANKATGRSPNVATLQSLASEQARLLVALCKVVATRLEHVDAATSWGKHVRFVLHLARQLDDVALKDASAQPQDQTSDQRDRVAELPGQPEDKGRLKRLHNRVSARKSRTARTVCAIQSEILCAVQYWLSVLLADEVTRTQLMSLPFCKLAAGYVLSASNKIALENLTEGRVLGDALGEDCCSGDDKPARASGARTWPSDEATDDREARRRKRARRS